MEWTQAGLTCLTNRLYMQRYNAIEQLVYHECYEAGATNDQIEELRFIGLHVVDLALDPGMATDTVQNLRSTDPFFDTAEITPHVCGADCEHSAEVAVMTGEMAKFTGGCVVRSIQAGFGHDVGKADLGLEVRLRSILSDPNWGSEQTLQVVPHPEHTYGRLSGQIDELVALADRYHHTPEDHLPPELRQDAGFMAVYDALGVADFVNASITRTNSRNRGMSQEERRQHCLSFMTAKLHKYYGEETEAVAAQAFDVLAGRLRQMAEL